MPSGHPGQVNFPASQLLFFFNFYLPDRRGPLEAVFQLNKKKSDLRLAQGKHNLRAACPEFNLFFCKISFSNWKSIVHLECHHAYTQLFVFGWLLPLVFFTQLLFWNFEYCSEISLFIYNFTRAIFSAEVFEIWTFFCPIAVFFLEFWKRKEITLAYHWDVLEYEEEEVMETKQTFNSLTEEGEGGLAWVLSYGYVPLWMVWFSDSLVWERV